MYPQPHATTTTRPTATRSDLAAEYAKRIAAYQPTAPVSDRRKRRASKASTKAARLIACNEPMRVTFAGTGFMPECNRRTGYDEQFANHDWCASEFVPLTKIQLESRRAYATNYAEIKAGKKFESNVGNARWGRGNHQRVASSHAAGM